MSWNCGDALRQWQRGLRNRYPDRQLVFIALKRGTDTVACFDGDDGTVVVFDDFVDSLVRGGSTFPSFRAWFMGIVDAMFDFDNFYDLTL